MALKIAVDGERLAEFCRRHHVKTLALFGSVLRDDFRPDSDVDVLVEFQPGASAQLSLLDLVRMQEELQAIFGREVDLVEKAALRNPFRRHEILRTAEIVYAA